MTLPDRKTLAAGLALVLAPLTIAACSSEDSSDLTGTWKGQLNGYTVVGKQAINEGQGSKITIEVGKIRKQAFTATINFPVTGAKGTVKTKVPGVISAEGDEVWMAGANGYYLGQFEDDGLELTYLKSFTVDPSDASGNGIENVAQVGQFERVK